MAVKSVDAVLNEIMNDYKAIAIEAVENAAKKAQKDIVEEAENYLQQYYKNYQPRIYKRTDRLKHAIVPYYEDFSTAKKLSIEVGVEYNSDMLRKMYKSRSKYHQSGYDWKSVTDYSRDGFKSDYGMPEPGWILENFLQGIHPYTERRNGKWIYDDNRYRDSENTQSLMEEFFDTQLPGRIQEYVQTELFDAIMDRI